MRELKPQQVLEDSIERMNVWCSKHPTGVLTLTGRGARLRVVPEENGWLLKSLDQWGNTTLIRAFTREDVQKLVHRILIWSYDYAFK